MSCQRASSSLIGLTAQSRQASTSTARTIASASLAPSSTCRHAKASKRSLSSSSHRSQPISASHVLRNVAQTRGLRASQPETFHFDRAAPLGSKLTEQDILSFFSRSPFPSQNLLGDNAELATRAMTHESFRYAQDGHNRRLSFLGRRSLKMFMTLYLHSSLNAASPSSKAYISKLLESPEAVDDILHTSRMGDKIGRQLGLEKVMRWMPAVTDGQRGPKETGLFKIRGVCLEALVGAICHHAGADKAQQFFHALILPGLVAETFPAGAPEEVAQKAQEVAKAAKEALA